MKQRQMWNLSVYSQKHDKMVLLNFALSALLFQFAFALHCDKDALVNYRVEEYFKEITAKSFISDTPPSKTNLTWYFNLCDQQEILNEDCPKNAQICGVQEVSLPGSTAIKTQIIAFGNGLNYNIKNSNKDGLSIQLDESSWGSNNIYADINLACANPDSENLDLSWDNTLLNITWSTPAACLKSDESVPPPKEGDDKDKDGQESDDSWGWFTWLFIILVLLIGGYIILTAWITASRSPADFQDAVHDFVETLGNIAGSLPGFLKEIFGKVFGSNTNRGGYSAV